jgi:hypothetical protein
MRKVLFVIIPLVSLAFILSCQENFSPKAALPDKYVFNLIMRGDTTVQIAYLSRLYDVANYNPSSLATDPAVDGAVIAINYTGDSKQYIFRDTLDNGVPNQRYKTPSKYYYLSNFRPAVNKEIQLNITLPDGQKMTSKTILPPAIVFDNNLSTPYIPGSYFNTDSVYINVYWNNSNSNSAKAKRVSFVYFHKELNGTKTRHIKQVPIVAVIQGDSTAYDYNDIEFENALHLPRALLDKALLEISAGDPQKGRYLIAPLRVDVLLFDDSLSKLYSANLFYNYGFTIKNYPTSLTDITGGLGYFASYAQVTHYISFDPPYLMNKYGYLADSSNYAY